MGPLCPLHPSLMRKQEEAGRSGCQQPPPRWSVEMERITQGQWARGLLSVPSCIQTPRTFQCDLVTVFGYVLEPCAGRGGLVGP